MGSKSSKVLPQRELTIFDIISKIENNINIICNTEYPDNKLICDTYNLLFEGNSFIKNCNLHPIIKKWLKMQILTNKHKLLYVGNDNNRINNIKEIVDFNIISEEDASK